MNDNGMMYDGLVRCPFCGAENTDVMGFIKHLDDCYLMLRWMGGAVHRQLKAAWNTRPLEDALRAEIATQNAEVERLRKALESLRVKNHFVNEDDCWYSCPMSDSYCGEDRRDKCNCGMHRTNAVIDKALKGGVK